MLRLTKYLKPYIGLILIAVVLLFVQAMADLSLPNYMSDMVNVGIQQGGIDTSVPEAIRADQMDKLVLFLTEDEAFRVMADYTLVDEDSADYEQIISDYPAAADEPIYILKDIDQTETDILNPIMGKALLAVSGIEQAISDPERAQALAAQSGFDLSKIPAGMDIFTLLQQMPAEQIAQIKNTMDSSFSAMDDQTIVQAAASVVKDEYVALGMNTDKIQTNYLLHTGLLMLLVTLVTVVCTIIVGLLGARTGAGVARDLRKAVFEKVEDFSKAEYDKFSTASLITRTTNDVVQIQMMIVMMLRMVVYAPIVGVGAIIRAVEKSPSMTWIIGLAVIILLGLITTVFSIALPKFKLVQKLIDRLNQVSRENLSGMLVTRAFNNQEFELNRFDKANRDLTQNTLFINRIMTIMMPVMMLLMNSLSVLIIWVGAHQVADLTIQVGDMMAYLQYAMQVVFSFLMVSMTFIFLPRASVSGQRIAEVLDVEPSIIDPVAPKKFSPDAKGLVEFRDVSFRYPGAEENMLCNINFTAKPGETTAIIGSTGSGKSTVVNLIPRFFDVTEGTVLVDGLDVREVTQHDLRDRIGYIPQKGLLFSGTVESNLLFADEDASPETLKKSVEIAQAAEFVENMEGGMAAEISQGGTNVSGGQRQRLAIARALVKKPSIYIFDDAFSALDFKTEAALRQALKEETGESTLIVVTQRVSPIKTAEQIIVINDGMIVGKGKHEDLLQTCETYREIASSQLTEEELK
ncbi:MAG: ABC transporter ATP-binding protein [Anaerolineaceae bacterium]|nr:ABC transporter ATP-binding protein [Anaerolineaceae bacterium]